MAYTSVQLKGSVRQALVERYHTVDGALLRRLTEAGMNWVRANQESVNTLNVFPVPDGDTGTNMALTMQSAWDEISDTNETNIGKVAHAIAHGALMGARGNSGVILSQLWRGFARVVDASPQADAAMIVAALEEARDTAYRGVVRPVEGTILTVSKDVAESARRALDQGADSPLEILEHVVAAADESVRCTPDLLPILKEAGVVDAGGMGLFFLLEGMLRAAYRQPLDQPEAVVQPLSSLALHDASEMIEPGQDWEVVVDFHPGVQFDLRSFYSQLETMGTSIQVGEGDGLYRVHIHVPDHTEYDTIEYVKTLGTVSQIRLENLVAQMAGRAASSMSAAIELSEVGPDQIGTVVVSPGEGISRVFASLGASAIVKGGQSMNPSTQEILAAVEALPTDKIVILPNNKNIQLCAQQAVEMTSKQARVIPTHSIPEGIAAILALDPEAPLDTAVASMDDAKDVVRTLELTVATRSVEIDGVEVRRGQVIGLLDGKLVVAGEDLADTFTELLDQAGITEAELLTVYYGTDLACERARAVVDRIRETHPDLEIELVDGGQPHYQLIASIE
jgi:DAK2 domain fusion protein YloV